jgi:hypothetical protein
MGLAAGCSMRPAPQAVRAPSLPVWQIPPDALGTQRLYRVSYSGPEGEGSFKVTLRLVSPERYEIQAADPVGRALWSLDVLDERGLWIDHRGRAYCVFEGRFEMRGFPLGPFPLLALPSLLLGRVPAEPAGPVEQKGEETVFLDAAGRRWAATAEGGLVEGWNLAEGDAPTVWWRLYEGSAILSDRGRGVQIRWREVLREKLQGDLERLTPPSGYRQTECQSPELP